MSTIIPNDKVGSMRPLLISSWPEAILHLDADAFFASVEQAVHPEYRGQPVITGAERNIVASMSYEAKGRGIERGMRMTEVKKIIPDCVILPSDYETYSLFSQRMFNILRRFAITVEESSIDEGFADLKGLRRVYRSSYRGIAERIHATLQHELGITISVGVSVTKTLAKLASKHKKPSGLTVVSGRYIHELLAVTPIRKVCGIGENTEALLKKYRVETAYDFTQLSETFVKKLLGKTGLELWQELRGKKIYALDPNKKVTYQTISKTKTFTPASRDPAYIYAQLLRNCESAFIKARRYNLYARRIILFLKNQQFQGFGIQATLDRPVNSHLALTEVLRKGFDALFRSRMAYRSTGVVLAELTDVEPRQPTLFEPPATSFKLEFVGHAIDQVARRWGKHTVHALATLPLKTRGQHDGTRETIPARKKITFTGESSRRRLGVPMVHITA